MKTLEERVSILEKTLKNLQDSFIQAQKNLSPTTAKVDDTANGLKTTNGNVEQNTTDISDNSMGLFDVASLADENSQAIMELAEIIGEMEG